MLVSFLQQFWWGKADMNEEEVRTPEDEVFPGRKSRRMKGSSGRFEKMPTGMSGEGEPCGLEA